MKLTKSSRLLVGGTIGLVRVATVTLVTRKRNWMQKLVAWKKAKNQNAYYDSITQEDIAWG